MKSLFTILFFLFISTFVYAQENWKLIYENDANGNRVSGDFSELVLAIQRGETIRLYFRMGRLDEPHIYVEHITFVKFSTIMNSPKGQFVTAQIDPIVGQIPDFNNEQVLLKENLEWSLIASTNGKNDTMTRNVITGEIINHGILRWGTKWFVKK